MKVRKRANPARRPCRLLARAGTHSDLKAACAMASSGLETTIKMQLGEYLHDFSVTVLHDFVVGVEQVVAAHAGLARECRR